MIDFSIINISDTVNVTCVDGEEIAGTIINIEDEEESDIGEIAIKIATTDGRHIVIGKSEIKSIKTKAE